MLRRGEIQWDNVSTIQIEKPVTCARNIKSTNVKRVFVAVIPAGTVNTDPHVLYGSWRKRRRQRSIGFLCVYEFQDLNTCPPCRENLTDAGCWFLDAGHSVEGFHPVTSIQHPVSLCFKHLVKNTSNVAV